MDIDMCKSFIAIEMIDRETEKIVANIQGTMYFGKILPHARINLEGYVMHSGLGTMWFIATHYVLASTVESIQKEINRMKGMHPNAKIKVTERGKQLIDKLKLNVSNE